MAKELIDIYGVMQHIPDILELDLVWKKDAWEGGYYIDGTPHHKKDKLKIKFWRSDKGCSIWLHEQGGASMSLQQWLQEYGGAADWNHAMDIMRGNARPDARLTNLCRHEYSRKVCYVEKSEYEGCASFELERCPLFVWMSCLFGRERTAETWRKYHVTTDSEGLAVFWYTNKDGKICYDKRIRYNYNGHRDKTFGGTRKFRTAQGYTERPLFGEHLIIDKTVNVLESEKTVLLSALAYPNEVFVATGGKGNIGMVKDFDCRLLPDMDAIKEWKAAEKPIIEWWKGQDMGDTDDFGDLIIRLKYKQQ